MHPNAEVVLRGFQAFAEGDMDSMRSLFTDDATWHSGGRNKWSGDYTGPDSIVQMMGGLGSGDYTGPDSIVQMMGGLGSDATIENQPHAVLADDDHVVVLNNSSQSRNGRNFSGNNVFVFHVSDGKVTEVWTVSADPYGLDEFWAD